MTIGVWRGPNRKYVGGVVELWSCSMKSNILYTVYKFQTVRASYRRDRLYPNF
jgi:hypothetical protein